MSQTSRLQKYKKEWEDIPHLKGWLSALEGDEHAAFCKVCCRPLNAHKKDLLVHAKTNKHRKNFLKCKNENMHFDVDIENTARMVVKEEIMELNSDWERGPKNVTIDVCAPNRDIEDEIEAKITSDSFVELDQTASITINEAGSPELFFSKLKQAPEFKDWLIAKGNMFHCTLCKKDILRKVDLLKHGSNKSHNIRCKKLGYPVFDDTDRNLSTLIFGSSIRETEQIRIIDLTNDMGDTLTDQIKDTMHEGKMEVDLFGEESTVKKLEEKVAEFLQKESALLMPTGELSNLIAVLVHCSSRDSVAMVGHESQLHKESQSALARNGVPSHILQNESDGSFSIDDLKTIVQSNASSTWPITTLVCVENTHNRLGGRALSEHWLKELGEYCDANGLLLHMDGSRLLQASVATGQHPSHIVCHCDSVTFGLDKGLGARLGSILVGSCDFIDKARSLRLPFGGEMHKAAGFLVAPALHSFSTYISRMHLDNINARNIAQNVNELHSSAVTVDLSAVRTNIVLLHTDNIRLNAKDLCDRLSEVKDGELAIVGQRVKILVEPISQTVVRFMTHMSLSEIDIQLVLKKIRFVIREYDSMLHLSLYS